MASLFVGEPMKSLEGKKTYIVAAGMVAYAVIGAALGYVEIDRAIELLMEAAALAGLRNGIKTDTK